MYHQIWCDANASGLISFMLVDTDVVVMLLLVVVIWTAGYTQSLPIYMQKAYAAVAPVKRCKCPFMFIYHLIICLSHALATVSADLMLWEFLFMPWSMRELPTKRPRARRARRLERKINDSHFKMMRTRPRNFSLHICVRHKNIRWCCIRHPRNYRRGAACIM